jgi:hypothetical protein
VLITSEFACSKSDTTLGCKAISHARKRGVEPCPFISAVNPGASASKYLIMASFLLNNFLLMHGIIALKIMKIKLVRFFIFYKL